MDLKMILIYCVCADFLKEIGHLSNHSQRMTDDEVLTFAIRPLSKLALLVKTALFGIFIIQFFGHIFGYDLKIG